MTKHPLNLGKGDMTDRYDLIWENESLADSSIPSIAFDDYRLLYIMFYDCIPSDSLTVSSILIAKDSYIKNIDQSSPSGAVMWDFYPTRMDSKIYGPLYYRDVCLSRIYPYRNNPYIYFDSLSISNLYNTYGVAVDESTSEQKHLVPYCIYGIR